MEEQFENKVVIITGSTQGSGAETARLFAKRGAKAITICGRQETKGNEYGHVLHRTAVVIMCMLFFYGMINLVWRLTW